MHLLVYSMQIPTAFLMLTDPTQGGLVELKTALNTYHGTNWFPCTGGLASCITEFLGVTIMRNYCHDTTKQNEWLRKLQLWTSATESLSSEWMIECFKWTFNQTSVTFPLNDWMIHSKTNVAHLNWYGPLSKPCTSQPSGRSQTLPGLLAI